jgi:hypothetical protein
LLSYVRDFNWAYRDGFPDLGFIQRSFLFTLYLLNLYGGEWLPEVFYEDAFLRTVIAGGQSLRQTGSVILPGGNRGIRDLHAET